MNVLIVLAVLGILALLIWSVFAINDYCTGRYSYEPINLWNTSAMAIVIIMLVISIATVPEGQNPAELIDHALKFRITEAESDTVALLALSLITAVTVYVRLLVKTNILVATYAIVVNLFAVPVIVIFLVGAAAVLENTRGPKSRKRR